MNRFVCAFFLVVIGTASLGADEPGYQTVLSHGTLDQLKEAGFYGSVRFDAFGIGDDRLSLTGVELGAYWPSGFFLGCYGEGSVNQAQVLIKDRNHHIQTGQGGLCAGYAFRRSDALHFEIDMRIGMGTYIATFEKQKLFSGVDADYETDALIFTPGCYAVMNLTRFLNMGIGMGYSFANTDNSDIFSSGDLSQFTAMVKLSAGAFGY